MCDSKLEPEVDSAKVCGLPLSISQLHVEVANRGLMVVEVMGVNALRVVLVILNRSDDVVL